MLLLAAGFLTNLNNSLIKIFYVCSLAVKILGFHRKCAENKV